MNIQEQIASNQAKTWVILIIFSVVAGILGWLFATLMGFRIGSLGYFGFSLLFVGFMNFASYYWSDKIVLKMAGAKSVTRKESPDLYKSVLHLSKVAEIPMPKLYTVNDPTPNAFATGRDPQHASVAVHTGLLERLDKEELEGVIAHELAHVKNFDTRIMAIVAMIAGLLSIFADMFRFQTMFGGRDDEDSSPSPIFMALGIAASILAPIAAMLVQFAISRRREFLADVSGAYFTKNPDGLASALLKISSTKLVSPTAHTGTAHLYISNPFGAKGGQGLFKLFMTHPPVEDRVKALKSLKIL